MMRENDRKTFLNLAEVLILEIKAFELFAFKFKGEKTKQYLLLLLLLGQGCKVCVLLKKYDCFQCSFSLFLSDWLA